MIAAIKAMALDYMALMRRNVRICEQINVRQERIEARLFEQHQVWVASQKLVGSRKDRVAWMVGQIVGGDFEWARAPGQIVNRAEELVDEIDRRFP